MGIVGDGFLVRNFIQRPAMGAFEGLFHLTNISLLRSHPLGLTAAM
jgi:hypothetical protein